MAAAIKMHHARTDARAARPARRLAAAKARADAAAKGLARRAAALVRRDPLASDPRQPILFAVLPMDEPLLPAPARWVAACASLPSWMIAEGSASIAAAPAAVPPCASEPIAPPHPYTEMSPDELVAAAKTRAIWDLGGMTSSQKAALDRARKRGEIVRSRAYWMNLGSLRSVWHPLGSFEANGHIRNLPSSRVPEDWRAVA